MRRAARWIALLALGIVLGACSMDRDDRRALTAEEVQAEVAEHSGTLLAATTIDTRSVIFMDSPDGKRCHVSQIRDTGPAFGGNSVLATVPISEPVTVLPNWSPAGLEERQIFCIAINDAALQRAVVRVQLILPDGAAAEANVAGQPDFIISIPAHNPLLSYQLRFFDAENRVLHTETDR
ncbi:MAG TPA: hypothetical protein VD886_07990 [Herpetosiphonaceae bacterium]|nr:hypothetical protein [Herpetosiphonaceae bacterium]